MYSVIILCIALLFHALFRLSTFLFIYKMDRDPKDDGIHRYHKKLIIAVLKFIG